MMVICNRMHMCGKRDECHHAKPHEHEQHRCGKGMYVCQSSGIMSGCTAVKDGTYQSAEREWCTCDKCGTQHSHEWVDARDAETGELVREGKDDSKGRQPT